MGAENIIVSSSVLLLCIQCYRAIPSTYRAIPVPAVQFPCLPCKHGTVGTGVPQLFTCAPLNCIVTSTFALAILSYEMDYFSKQHGVVWFNLSVFLKKDKDSHFREEMTRNSGFTRGQLFGLFKKQQWPQNLWCGREV